MIIHSLDLTRYGAFEGREFHLGPGLTVIHGPNEAGKSTFRSALGDFLWGMPNRNHRQAFRFAVGTLRLTAVLEDPGTPQSCVTVTCSSRTHVDGDGSSIAPWWQEGSITSRDAWQMALGLDLESLRRGSDEVLRGQGDLKSLIFRARTGVDLESQRKLLGDKANEFYRAHGGAKEVKIRRRIVTVLQLTEEAARAISSASAVMKLRSEVTVAERDHEEAKAVQREADRALSEAQLRKKCFPIAQKIAAARSRMLELESSGRLLTQSELSEYDAATRQVEGALERLDALTQELDQVEEKIDKYAFDPSILLVEEAIDSLVARRALMKATEDRLAQLEVEARDRDSLMRRLIIDLDPVAALNPDFASETIEVAARLLLSSDQVALLNELSGLLDSALTAERNALDKHGRTSQMRRRLLEEHSGSGRLEQSYERRDAAWGGIRGPFLAGDLPEESTRCNLVDVFEEASAAADELARSAITDAEHVGQVRELDRSLEEAGRVLDEAQAETRVLRSKWEIALDGANLLPTLSPAAWRTRAESHSELVLAIGQQAETTQDVRRLAGELQEFHSEVASVGVTVGIHGADPWILLDRLAEQVKDARTKKSGRSESEQRRTKLQGDEKHLRTTIQQGESSIADLKLGMEAEVLLRRARQYQELANDLRDDIERLADLAGADGPLDQIVLELQDLNEEDVDSAASDAEELREAATESRAECNARLRDAQRELDRAQAAGDAALLNARVSEEKERLVEDVEEYLLLRIESLILGRALTAAQPHSSSPLVERAGVFAQRLTLGRVRGFDIEEAEPGNRLRILAEELDEGEPDGLSTGTADQVYLALRLSGIREQQEASRRSGAGPLPVVLDDVLQASDDNRTRAAVELLMEEARDQQIILLTHHAAVASVAAELGAQVVYLDPRPEPGIESSSNPSQSAEFRPDPATVRGWARAQGIEVSERGRIAKELVAAFLASQAEEIG